MPEFRYKARVGNVGSYQLSGVPFISSSIDVPINTEVPFEVQFPNVSKFVTVTNDNSGSNVALRVGFSQRGVAGAENATSERPQALVPEGAKNNYYFILNNGESYTGEWRVSSVYLRADSGDGCEATVIAGLTGIDYRELGSNWSGSVGVG
jgi:hypothetical protein